MNNSQEDEPEQTETVQQEIPEATENQETEVSQEEEPNASTEVAQTQYNIQLPDGWSEESGSTAPAGAPETYHQYANENGQTLGVSINSGGFGGGGDGSASFAIEGNKFVLDETYDACDPAVDELGVCRFGDGELYLLVGSASEYNGNNYMFWFWDDNSEDQSAYQNLKDIVETIELL